MTIKIDQNKFYHYNPLTEMTAGARSRGEIQTRAPKVYLKV